jgi:hypothetical protein
MDRRNVLRGVLRGVLIAGGGAAVLLESGVSEAMTIKESGAADADPLIQKAQTVVVGPRRGRRVCWWRRGRRVCAWR